VREKSGAWSLSMQSMSSSVSDLSRRQRLPICTAEHENRVQSTSAWIRRRIQQIDSLTSPEFLDLSARSAKLEFSERPRDHKGEEQAGYYSFLSIARLQFWSIDEEKELATSISAFEWAAEAGLVPQPDSDETIQEE
jgi:hypothetical protein